MTLCCVSNQVGGDLIGNAWWSGVLDRATCSPRPASTPDADAVLSTLASTAGPPVRRSRR